MLCPGPGGAPFAGLAYASSPASAGARHATGHVSTAQLCSECTGRHAWAMRTKLARTVLPALQHGLALDVVAIAVAAGPASAPGTPACWDTGGSLRDGLEQH